MQISITCWLLLLCFLPCSSQVYGSNEGGKETKSYHVIKRVSTNLQAPACSPHTPIQGDARTYTSSLKIFHKHGPCSKPRHGSQIPQSNEESKSQDQIVLDHDRFFHADQTRVNYIQFRLSKNEKTKQLRKHSSEGSSVPSYSGIPLGSGNYYVTIGFGTPKRDLSLIFDTGSDFTWIQCSPCSVSCYQQEEPIFDPSQSATYSNVSCNSRECFELRTATSISPRCSSSNCIYGIQYGDQSFSVGFLGSDKLTLTSKDVFPKFLFGCGEYNIGLFGRTGGMLGLGRDKLSFVYQTRKAYRQLFSYCFPAALDSTGYLTFGKEKLNTSTKYTPLLTDPRDPSFYFLELISISVGGTKLAIPTSVFKLSGTLIDSGTVITRLPPSAYSIFRSSFRSAMSEYNLTQPLSLLDTCYNLTGYDTYIIPMITLYFKGGVKLDLDDSGILVGTESQACLAFAGNEDDREVAILGNQQQRTHRVVYDITRKRLGFSPGGCS